MNNDTKIPILQDLLVKGQPDATEQEVGQSAASLTLDENTDVEIEQDESDLVINDEQETLPEEITYEERREELPEVIKTETQQQAKASTQPDTEKLILDEEIRMILDKYIDKAYKKIIRLLNDRKS